ncbi:hypothetical protein [Levilactobacillus sp. HBUAS70063]|uniref:hypothetical protein n=1 Tax=Levilactobacillus sp. HBUAS70063 TaxID=3109359 RepID=UPI0031331EC8
MSVNIFTLNAMKKSPLAMKLFAMKLFDTLGSYIVDYTLSEDNSVDDETEEKTVELLKQCNEFAISHNMEELCTIYEVFSLMQDIVIIYTSVVQELVKEKQQVEEVEINIQLKGN